MRFALYLTRSDPNVATGKTAEPCSSGLGGRFFNFQRPVLLPALLSGDGRGWKHWLSKLVFNWKLAGLRALHYSSPRQESSASYIPSAAAAGAAAASRAGRKREREREGGQIYRAEK